MLLKQQLCLSSICRLQIYKGSQTESEGPSGNILLHFYESNGFTSKEIKKWAVKEAIEGENLRLFID